MSMLKGKKTENILGVKLLCVITKDDTEYDSDVTNLYEKVTIKDSRSKLS